MTQSITNKFNNTIGAVANLDFASLWNSKEEIKIQKIQKILKNIKKL